MNKILIILFIILAAIIALSVYMWSGFGSQIIGAKSFEMFLTVGDKIGFNIDTNAVYFGKTLPDSAAKRDLLISNDFNEKVLVAVEKSGDLAGWVEPSQNDFYLNAKESKTITLTATVPADAKKSDYFGVVTVYYIKAHN